MRYHFNCFSRRELSGRGEACTKNSSAQRSSQHCPLSLAKKPMHWSKRLTPSSRMSGADAHHQFASRLRVFENHDLALQLGRGSHHTRAPQRNTAQAGEALVAGCLHADLSAELVASVRNRVAPFLEDIAEAQQHFREAAQRAAERQFQG